MVAQDNGTDRVEGQGLSTALSGLERGSRRVPSLIVQVDRDELRVLRADSSQSAPWRGEGDVRVRTSPAGHVVGLRIVGFQKWASDRAVLVDVIARTMALEHDDVARVLEDLPL